ncbi:TPA: Asp-tRNA(Asn)/Glu-tRNA(Gln) amidotransferase subunit GatC [Candidatus Woesearchaeota archaeon]|nr:MAG: aspartyl-tRNA(Asn)/glutamyl-tRNA (Gln) amidotransferase subunit C [archaeon GW2011_AR11]MBS3110524.1 Asp-tRNA(Asn)/Glu-tRNA(Gln) amidotransferase subunit GatC [Candidatus Woesearchaeota archaeon]HIH05456.1 Asp-tRNA(Asn)/Glu-tRNA(Gln) amidotransferase subunit GatC [Candidatus Woesearchaeota archaeon]HIH91791.1 Asp-tRNA(Asn)/Glu-tRNA(Gln) amidotransferase subunit GatC [Candidatus Woesearchaeota archaeon]HII65050.1 Asp-tRNA(Asn)/Glu-tRNA(Gln) amidotransferase subunit GatC [Candidatus Woese
MDIDRKLIESVAVVARLRLTDREVEKFLPQLKDVLEAFSSVQEVDTAGIEPSFHPLPLKDVLRDDTPAGCLGQEDALSLTPHKKDGYFKGPKAV